ncbi:hypothetical protein BH11MYX4_BH11MYX4_09550 [soil metagenome]
MRASLSLAVALVVAACSSSSSRSGFADEDAGSASDDAGADASAPPIFGDAGGARDAAASGTSCEREIKLGKVSISNQACFVNEHVSNKKTKLEFACAGGTASATFDGHTFKCTITGDVIALTDVEKFTFNNCQWESTEKIDGDLAKGTLTYSYAEKPVVSCPDMPCTAGGTVSVSAGAVVVVR